jgi:histidyl-tRNA synthetase
VAVILGESELASGNASVKWLREADAKQQAQQEAVSLADLVTALKDKV